MKKILTIFILSTVLGLCNAQYINIADTAFVKCLCTKYPELLDSSCRKLDTLKASNHPGTLNLYGYINLDTIPEIEYFKNIDSLHLGLTKLKDLNHISKLTQLQYLGMSHCPIENLDGLDNLVNLEHLDLSGTGISTWPDFTPLTKLKNLFVASNNLTDPYDFSSNPTLEWIRITNNYFSYSELHEFMKLPNAYFIYDLFPQKEKIQDSTISIPSGNEFKITYDLDYGIDGLSYVWYKGSEIVDTTSGRDFVIENTITSDTGRYFVLVYNDDILPLRDVFDGKKLAFVGSGTWTLELDTCQSVSEMSYKETPTCEGAELSTSFIGLSNWNEDRFDFYFKNSTTGSEINLESGSATLPQGTYKFVVDDREDCRVEFAEEIEISPSVTCESVFTPNGDNNNDKWLVPFEYPTEVINQAGEVLKTLSPDSYWDGTDENGNPVPTAVYLIKDSEGNYITLTVLW